MIGSKELRKGNKLLHLNEVITVENICGAFINPVFYTDSETYGEGILYEKIEAIPLTHDILINCGFNNIHSAYLLSTVFLYEGPGFWNGQKGWAVGIRDEISMRIIRCIDYLHQLQNLYFTLTGEELHINWPLIHA